MVVDLMTRQLDADRWGFKAARLSQATHLGIAVPPTLCLRAESLNADERAVEAIETWLGMYRPRRVVIRTSSAYEDGPVTAQAGRSTTLLNCPPDAAALVRAISCDLMAAPEFSDDGACVMVQEQIEARLYGVAFYSSGRLLVEAAPRPDDVTGGREPTVRIAVEHARLRTATVNPALPVLLLAHRLHRVCRLLAARLGFDPDVEWAWAGAMIVVLQARPITAAPTGWAS